MSQYTLIDSGNERKIEQFGPYRIIRPCSQAIWDPWFPEEWSNYHGEFLRDRGNRWGKKNIPLSWVITYQGIQLKLMPTSFGHLGIFPEHALHWEWIEERVQPEKTPILNLFAYSGATSLMLAKKNVKVCHLDSSKGMVAWAKENAHLNSLSSIRWIVDDASAFLKREIRRGVYYQGVILDPPSFGRGVQGQVFKIERNLCSLLRLCRQVVVENGFIVLTAHTPGVTPTVLKNVLMQTQRKGCIEMGEMLISAEFGSLPSGSYARWYGE